MADATWLGKMPADMTLEELQGVKALMAAEFSVAQERAMSLSEQMQALDYQIAMRFGMPTDPEVRTPSYSPDIAAALLS